MKSLCKNGQDFVCQKLSVLLQSNLSMSTILTPEIGQQEAANDRFFFYETEAIESRDVFAFSRNFSCRYSDLLPESAGLVLQTAADADGKLVGIHDANKIQNLTLCFDARPGPTAYVWELTETGLEGRDVYQLHTSPDSYAVYHFSFDMQGRLLAKQPYEDREELVEKVRMVAQHDRMREGAEKMRRSRDQMVRNLSRFSVEAITKLNPKLYEKEIARKQNMIDHLGFLAMKPMELKPGITPVLSVS